MNELILEFMKEHYQHSADPLLFLLLALSYIFSTNLFIQEHFSFYCVFLFGGKGSWGEFACCFVLKSGDCMTYY